MDNYYTCVFSQARYSDQQREKQIPEFIIENKKKCQFFFLPKYPIIQLEEQLVLKDGNEISKDLFICPICQDLMTSVLQCEYCSNICCFNCWEKLISSNRPKCFFCRHYGITIKKLHNNLFYKKIFDQLMFKCCNQDCNLMFPYDHYYYHCCNKCEHRLLSCGLCNQTLKYSKIETHVDECLKVDGKCSYCNKKMDRVSFINNHHDKICPKFKLNL
ncbi:hypothetical protein DICPUDRAFT_79772 [Dictyostelium purpureum]|uniref:RING-type domain-containing protein n=1 Tax=Dictyostelium purpureum TaxID=5786 RepID=F0ZNK6_DICPU|nr:uncharacterized protein DICPUDRAFT_79772 [Dictyostelium purpureum]EGC34474.1 hypothetical protein DICPUDRAFT_79772 [Dictyostelium purpureum]|eukprot:XP_003289009.1 hypothetical protein DICPUDRAFT_79772 [Dictyostelium purpureum]